MNAAQLFLSAKQSKYFDGRHPWVLERSVVEPTVPLDPGQIVELLQPNGSWIGRGVYNPHSRIRVRLYQWHREQALDAAWVLRQLEYAVQLREQWMQAHQPLDAVRLVNSEGDGLSGLIVDRFGSYLVVQITALAMQQWQPAILDWLQSRFEPAGILVDIDGQFARHEGIPECHDWVAGQAPAQPVAISENGTRLNIDLQSGQKTGYYLDQRSNRLRAAKWFPGGRLLDVCCYQGGFSLAACQLGQVTEALAIDSSERSLTAARANAQENGCSQIEFQKADCFDFLQQAVQQQQTFDGVVLDPPRMASTRHQIQSALRAYHRLNLSAVNLLRPGGILVSCSCSGRVPREDFVGVLSSVAKRTRRRIQILESLHADFDHPYDVNCPETDYLKCLICRVE